MSIIDCLLIILTPPVFVVCLMRFMQWLTNKGHINSGMGDGY